MNLLITGLIALGCFLGTTTDAHAGPLIAAGLMFLIPTLAASTAAILGSVIALVAGIGLSYLAQRLLQKKPQSNVGGTVGRLQTGGTVPRSFPIGDRAVVSHSLVYANTFGQDGKTPNAYLAFDFVLADIPVGGGNEGLVELWVNGSQVTWNPAATPGTEGIAIPEFNKDGKDHLWIRFYDGTQTTADARLVELFSGDADRPYTSTRVGIGMVKAVATVRYNRELFGGFPAFKFVLKGIPLYDVREDSTAGGSGAQRWNTPDTWTEAPANPVLAIYNLLRGIQYDGAWFFGGQTVSEAQLPVSAWAAAMNECDVEIELADSGSPAQTEPQFACSGEVRLDMEPAQVIKDLLMACNGRLAEVGGVYKPHVGAAGSAVMSITDSDILITESQTFDPFKSLADQINGVTAKYIEPQEGWSAKDAPPFYNPDLEEEDGGRRQLVDVTYDYVVSGTQVQRLARSAVLEARRERRHVIHLPPDAYPLEPNDFLSWSSDRNGYVNKLFRCDAVQDLANGVVGLSLTEVDPSDYDWDAETDEQAIVIAPTPRVDVPVQSIDDVDIEGVVIQGAGERAKAGARLIWDGEDQDDVRAVAFEIRVDGETDPIYQGETSENAVAEGEYIVSANLSPATDYEGRLKFIPFSGRQTGWSDWIEFTTPDVRLSWDEMSDRIQAASRLTSTFIQSINQRLDDLGGAVASIESVTTDANQAVTERARRLSSSLGLAKASVQVLELAVTTLDDAFALFQVETEASLDGITAEGLLQFEQVVSPPTGATSGVRMLVGASDDGGFAQAGLEAYAFAGGGGSPEGYVVLVGDRVYARDSIGGDPFPILDVSGRMLYSGIMPGATVQVLAFTRNAASTGYVNVGSGNVSGSTNSYREALMGTMDLVANTEAIIGGSGSQVPLLSMFRLTVECTGSYNGSALGPSMDFRVIARPTAGGSDVVLLGPMPVQYSTWSYGGGTNNWSWFWGLQGTQHAKDFDTAVIDAAEYDIYIQWRWGNMFHNVADSAYTVRFGGTLTTYAFIR